ncbi:hypothetical protein D3C75_722730 [compost metagenome]
MAAASWLSTPLSCRSSLHDNQRRDLCLTGRLRQIQLIQLQQHLFQAFAQVLQERLFIADLIIQLRFVFIELEVVVVLVEILAQGKPGEHRRFPVQIRHLCIG